MTTLNSLLFKLNDSIEKTNETIQLLKQIIVLLVALLGYLGRNEEGKNMIRQFHQILQFNHERTKGSNEFRSLAKEEGKYQLKAH